MDKYTEYMKKAHGALILERENEIIMELRATRAYLEDKISALDGKVDGGFEVVSVRLDGMEKKLEEIVSLLKK